MRSAIALPARPPATAPAAAPTTVPTGPATEPAAAPAAMPPAAAPMPVPTGCEPGLPEMGSRLASAPSFLFMAMGNVLLSRVWILRPGGRISATAPQEAMAQVGYAWAFPCPQEFTKEPTP